MHATAGGGGGAGRAILLFALLTQWIMVVETRIFNFELENTHTKHFMKKKSGKCVHEILLVSSSATTR